MDKKRCVIVGGTKINNYDAVRSYIQADDYMIYCDCGLLHENMIGKSADLIVGDFDSYEVPKRKAETIILPCEKDDTDTMFAVKEGLNRGFDEFLLVGVIGGTFDHTFANISILLYLNERSKKAMIVDDYSEMEVISDTVSYIDDSFEYFSVLSLGVTSNHVTIKNAKYTLDNAKIDMEYQYAVRNEPKKDEIASVEVKNGKLLIIKIRKN